MEYSQLRDKSVSATLWSGLDILAKRGIQFFVVLLLARLLSPADFGTIGMLSIFVGISTVFVESGFPTALIQRKEITEVDKSSVFFFNIFMASVICIFLWLLAPIIALFYGIAVLKPLTYIMAVNLLIGSFGSIQRTLLTRELNFRTQFNISIISILISGSIAVFLAWQDYGIWSLAIQAVSATTASTILLWILCPWRPIQAFSARSILSLFRFGGFLLLSSVLDILYTKLSTLVIGKFYSAKDLGYYTRAEETQILPAGLLSGIIARVALPIFSSARHDPTLLKSGLSKAVRTVMMINIPLMLGILATAKPLVLVLFGKQWFPCVPYLKILCLSGIFWPLHVLNLNVLMAQGYSNLFFRLEVIKKVLGVSLLLLACPVGIQGIAWSMVLSAVLCFIINAYYTGVFLKYGFLAQLYDLAPYFVGGGIMFGSAWAMPQIGIQQPSIQLLLQAAIGVAVYTLYCTVFRLEAFKDCLTFLTRQLIFHTQRNNL